MAKTATDVIKGLRKGKIDRTAFLTTVYSEIREEVKSHDLSVKSCAIRKLFILALEGYDMEWAAFHILEVMSSQKFSEKHSGLLAAAQCFKPNSDILLLATNLFRRELVPNSPVDTCIAINTLACIVNSDMAKELLNDCVTLLNASKPILRKKVCVLFFKMFLQYPEGLTQCFERLAEKLKDDSPGVVMGTVNTIFELSRINPGFVLFTAQSLYELLNTTNNNWVLIKLIKLVLGI
jgi:AP-3 complex subunit delta